MKLRSFVRGVAAVSVLSLACSAFGAEGEKHDLKPRFVKDAESKWVFEEKTNGSMKQGETARKAEQSQTLHLTRKVSVVDEKSATVELTITRVVASATPPMGGEPIVFDSTQAIEKDAGNMLALQFRQMIGKPYVFTVALDGEVTGVKPPETVLSTDSTDALKAKFAPLFQVKTGETLAAVGESWEKSEPLGGRSGMPIESKSKMTLSKVDDGVAIVALEGSIGFKEGQLPPGMELKNSGTKGEIKWSVAEGGLVELKSVQTMEMTNADMALEVISATETSLRRE